MVWLIVASAAEALPAADCDGNTPLWRAVFCSRGEGVTIRLLLEAGAAPDRDNVHGVSPRALAGGLPTMTWLFTFWPGWTPSGVVGWGS
ncbi:hypothetical protein ACGFZS_02780 [Streptomyces sp. NPDC048288]|uniref:hypothetical protein n=1 Tax=Streptomyces sp. NPDC048288 TaxID=3365529 RepID=UPI003710CD95